MLLGRASAYSNRGVSYIYAFVAVFCWPLMHLLVTSKFCSSVLLFSCLFLVCFVVSVYPEKTRSHLYIVDFFTFSLFFLYFFSGDVWIAVLPVFLWGYRFLKKGVSPIFFRNLYFSLSIWFFLYFSFRGVSKEQWLAWFSLGKFVGCFAFFVGVFILLYSLPFVDCFLKKTRTINRRSFSINQGRLRLPFFRWRTSLSLFFAFWVASSSSLRQAKGGRIIFLGLVLVCWFLHEINLVTIFKKLLGIGRCFWLRSTFALNLFFLFAFRGIPVGGRLLIFSALVLICFLCHNVNFINALKKACYFLLQVERIGVAKLFCFISGLFCLLSFVFFLLQPDSGYRVWRFFFFLLSFYVICIFVRDLYARVIVLSPSFSQNTLVRIFFFSYALLMLSSLSVRGSVCYGLILGVFSLTVMMSVCSYFEKTTFSDFFRELDLGWMRKEAFRTKSIAVFIALFLIYLFYLLKTLNDNYFDQTVAGNVVLETDLVSPLKKPKERVYSSSVSGLWLDQCLDEENPSFTGMLELPHPKEIYHSPLLGRGRCKRVQDRDFLFKAMNKKPIESGCFDSSKETKNEFSLEMLWLKAMADAQVYAQIVPQGDEDHPVMGYVEQGFQYSSGVNASWKRKVTDAWKLYASFMYFKAHPRATVKEDPLSGLLTALTTPILGGNGNVLFNQLRAKWKMYLRDADFALDILLKPTKQVSFSLFPGVKFLSVSQETTAHYYDYLVEVPADNTAQHVVGRNRFFGAGVNLGGQLDCNLPRRSSLFFRADYAKIYGNFHLRTIYRRHLLAPEATIRITQDVKRLVSSGSMRIGVSQKWGLSSHVDLDMAFGWEGRIWWDQVRTNWMSRVIIQPDGNNLMTTGFFLKSRLDF